MQCPFFQNNCWRCLIIFPIVGHTATRAALLTGFRGLLRKCQLTYSDLVLLCNCVSFHTWGMLVKIRKSKTIQFDQKELIIPISYVANRELCAVFWVKKHFTQVVVSDNSLAFQVPGGEGGFHLLQYASFQATIKFMANCAGLDPDHYSLHSLRWEERTFLAMQGAPLEEIKTRGACRLTLCSHTSVRLFRCIS